MTSVASSYVGLHRIAGVRHCPSRESFIPFCLQQWLRKASADALTSNRSHENIVWRMSAACVFVHTVTDVPGVNPSSQKSFGATTKRLGSETPYPRVRKSKNSITIKFRNVLEESPSTVVLDALRAAGIQHALPDSFPHKLDLSYVNPRALQKRQDWMWINTGQPSSLHFLRSAVPTLHSILAACIRQVFSNSSAGSERGTSETKRAVGGPQSDLTLLSAAENLEKAWNPTQTEFEFLEKEHYTPKDVQKWASILCERSSYKAAQLLACGSRATRNAVQSEKESVPHTVLLLFLRRKFISARALKVVLEHASERIGRDGLRVGNEQLEGTAPHQADRNKETWVAARRNQPEIDGHSVFIMFVRLLRHARKVMPHALPDIAALLANQLAYTSRTDSVTSSTRSTSGKLAKLTFLYNRALSLLSLPSSISPYTSIIYNERAQFQILERMAEHAPAIAITQEGYRAVTRTQLAHRKTSPEQQWALLKASSWPPWKESRTGLDSHIGPEEGVSRARKAMDRMQEAGYEPRIWESMAGIYSGWDTDNTPTIQTRTSLARVPSSMPKFLTEVEKGHDPVNSNNKDIWTARIRATRTLREAWACFLAFRDSGQRHHEDIYFAMFEKIRSDEFRRQEVGNCDGSSKAFQEPSSKAVLPGDGKEVHPDPLYPHEVVHIPSLPPSLEQLFDQMVSEGIKPSGECLIFLVRRASSLDQGFKFLRAAGKTSSALETLPIQLFTAVIALLCRFPKSRRHHLQQGHLRREILTGDLAFDYEHPIVHAFNLLNKRKPHYQPAWNLLLQALAKDPENANVLSNSLTSSGVGAMAVVRLMQQIVRTMADNNLDIDFAGFRWICVGFQSAAISCTKAERHSSTVAPDAFDKCENRFELTQSPQEASELFSKGSRYLRILFRALGGSDAINHSQYTSDRPDAGNPGTVPRLAAVPKLIHLHAYIRALGYLRDVEGIFSLVKWMIEFWPEIAVPASQSKGERRILRRVLTAVRVFLECDPEAYIPGVVQDQGRGFNEDTPQELALLARQAIESMPDWAGWPTDEEVEEYCEEARQPRSGHSSSTINGTSQ